MHETTHWQLQPSFRYDVLCLLNVLTNDPFYTHYYPGVYEQFSSRLPPAVGEALQHLKHEVKDTRGGIISADLCLLFSATDSETLPQMIADVEHPQALQHNFKTTPYYSEDEWQKFESVRADLLVIFGWLQTIDYEAEWQANLRPLAEQRIAELESELEGYNIVPAVEQRLGFTLPSNQITVYPLYYAKPHGIKITGARFLTAIDYPLRIFVFTAIHEMMHPPYFPQSDPDLKKMLDGLRDDPFLKAAFDNHDPSFGYNRFEDMVEEGVVRALDQIIGEGFGVSNPDPHTRWNQDDDGMHVFAAVLYSLLKKAPKVVPIRDFLLQLAEKGDLRSGNIQRLYDDYYAEKQD